MINWVQCSLEYPCKILLMGQRVISACLGLMCLLTRRFFPLRSHGRKSAYKLLKKLTWYGVTTHSKSTNYSVCQWSSCSPSRSLWISQFFIQWLGHCEFHNFLYSDQQGHLQHIIRSFHTPWQHVTNILSSLSNVLLKWPKIDLIQ